MYLLGILNSGLASFFLAASRAGSSGERYGEREIARIPVYTIDFEKKADHERHEKIVYYVRRMLELNGYLARATGGAEKRELERQIAATDREIDRIVRDLYGLTEEERIYIGGEPAEFPDRPA
jgi:hypothetical protein